MKTNRFFIIVAAAALLLISCSNDDERMLTIINEDGSCSREMSFHPFQEDVMAPLNKTIQTHGLYYNTDWERTWSVMGATTPTGSAPGQSWATPSAMHVL